MNKKYWSNAGPTACLLMTFTWFAAYAQPQLNRPARIDAPSLFGSTVSAKQLRNDPHGKAVWDFRIANDYLSRGDHKNGRKHLERALKKDPDYKEARLAYGVCLALLEEWELAVEQFEKTTQIAPHDFAANYNLGLALLRIQRAADAEVAARRALDLEPNDSLSNFLYGLAVEAQGKRTEKSLGCIRKAAETLPLARETLAKLEITALH